MRLAHVTGFCLTLLIVVALSEAYWLPWSKDGDKQQPQQPNPKPSQPHQNYVQRGLVKPGASQGQQPASKPQETSDKPADQAQSDSKTNGAASPGKQDNKPASKPQEKSAKPADKVQGGSKTNDAASPGKQDNKPASKPQDKSAKPADQAQGGSKTNGVDGPGKKDATVAEQVLAPIKETSIQQSIDDNAKKAELLKKVEKDLKKAQKNPDTSDVTQELVDLAKKRLKLKIALSLYSLVNSILYVAKMTGKVLPPPFSTIIYVMELLAKNIATKPLDDFFSNYYNEHAEATAHYVEKHPDEYNGKSLKVGKKIKVKTPNGEYKFMLLKKKRGEPIKPVNFTALSIFQQYKTIAQMKR